MNQKQRVSSDQTARASASVIPVSPASPRALSPAQEHSVPNLTSRDSETGLYTHLCFAVDGVFSVVFVLDCLHVLDQVRESSRIVPVRRHQPLFDRPET